VLEVCITSVHLACLSSDLWLLVSTGVRFTTLPDAMPPSAQLPSSDLPQASYQPPTTVTCLFNPMLGHISTAYTAKISRDLALSTRFDFNMYSFESEWTMGAEYWVRHRLHSDEGIAMAELLPNLPLKPIYHPDAQQDVQGVLKARVSTNNVSPKFDHLRKLKLAIFRIFLCSGKAGYEICCWALVLFLSFQVE